MSKTKTIGIIFLLSVVLAIAGLVGCQKDQVIVGPEEVEPISKINFEDIKPVEVVSLDAPVEPVEPVKVVGQAQFYNLGYSKSGKTVVFRGNLRDTKTFNDLTSQDVNVYCNGNFMNSGITDSKGHFEIVGTCASGTLWATTNYNDLPYESYHVGIVKTTSFRSSSRSSSSSSGSSDTAESNFEPATPVGVPEFSTTTLAAAIITACLGLALVRKR